ncbi:MAG: Fic family protein [bacterium]|nr:Fic family protein [bacterium]MDE0288681.1 Fic family protein [bacterium]MDE0439613.1 Fic family protein [bacterium]
MTWDRITGLDDNWEELASQELRPLIAVWSDQRESLLDTESLKEFNERLAREWAIETGILEGLYTLDRRITRLLIERGIDESLISHDATDRPVEQVAAHIHDQKQAVDWLFEFVKTERPFSESFIKELHALMTRSQETASGLDQFRQRVEMPLLRGAYKDQPNNPTRADGSVHRYCPPIQVTIEMERLVEFYDRYLGEGVAPEIFAAWLHHRFTQIHPFRDGNGRVARALASLVFLREGWFPLVIHRDQRSDYIDALEAADRGNLAPLIEMFASTQRKAFVNALGIAREVLKAGEHLDQLVAAIGDHFRKRDEDLARNMVRAKDHADHLWTRAGVTFARTSRQLRDAIRGVSERTVFDDFSAPSETSHRRRWHRAQIIKAAKVLGYYANIGEFSAWRRLVLETEAGRSEIVLSFHGIGREYRGLVGVSLCFYRKPETDEGHSMIEDQHTVSRELFQINYLESMDAVQARFDTWLDKYILQALDLWRRGE